MKFRAHTGYSIDTVSPMSIGNAAVPGCVFPGQYCRSGRARVKMQLPMLELYVRFIIGAFVNL